MLREYKGELFRKFALKLKKDKLWQRFIITEYYFRFYTNPNNSLLEIYNYIRDEKKNNILPLQWFVAKEKGRYGSYLDSMLVSDNDNYMFLKDFFKHYKV